MTQNQLQNEIAIIKSMIAKTKQEMAQSGSILIFIGIFGILYIAVITTLEILGIQKVLLPTMIGMTVLIAIGMIMVIHHQEKQEKIKSYIKSIYLVFIVACTIPLLIMTFLFPFTGIYAPNLVPVFAALLFGTILFSGGAVYEFSYLYWSGVFAWAGGCIIPYVHGYGRGIIMILILLNGFVIPGMILTIKYKNR